jgi:hypothetical protein
MIKKFIALILGGCLVTMIFWGFWHVFLKAKPKSATSNPLDAQVSTASSPALVAPAPAKNPLLDATALQVAHEAEVKREQKIWDSGLATPIAFYGKVVDEKGNPIRGARVEMSAANHPFSGGSRYERTTDGDGLFSISGIHGLGLMVSIAKEGYYQLPQSRGHFGYAQGAGGSSPHADAHDPAVFVLRKMGETDPLIVFSRDSRLARDGAPVQMDIHTGKTSPVANGDIQIESWVHDKDNPEGLNHSFDWSCRISIPGGGLASRSGGQFDFEAPTVGYQSEDVIDMPASAPNWQPSATREYFLKLPNGQYARIAFTIGAGGNNSFHITSYLNPLPGHRNLEYNPSNIPSISP